MASLGQGWRFCVKSTLCFSIMQMRPLTCCMHQHWRHFSASDWVDGSQVDPIVRVELQAGDVVLPSDGWQCYHAYQAQVWPKLCAERITRDVTTWLDGCLPSDFNRRTAHTADFQDSWARHWAKMCEKISHWRKSYDKLGYNTWMKQYFLDFFYQVVCACTSGFRTFQWKQGQPKRTEFWAASKS